MLDDAPRASVADLVRQVAEDGRAAVEAEIGVYKAIAGYRLSGIKVGAPLIVAAIFLLQAVLTALLVGLILALATLIGPGLATLAVVIAGFAVVGLLGWLGARKLGTLFAPLPDDEATS